MLLRPAVLLSITVTIITAKVYKRCELVNELKYVYKFPQNELSKWVCIVAHESLYNTSAMNPGSGDHGLFQISQLYWCSPPGDGFGCNAPCSSFRDDNIADDVECVRRIFREHKRLSGDGFNAWAVYHLYCKGDTHRYIDGCFGTETDNNIDSHMDVLTNYPTSSAKPIEEDDDGYEFPPLPSPPKKSSENVISIEDEDDVYDFPKLPDSKTNAVTEKLESKINQFSTITPISTNNLVTDITFVANAKLLINKNIFTENEFTGGINDKKLIFPKVDNIKIDNKKIFEASRLLDSSYGQSNSDAKFANEYIAPKPKQITFKPFSRYPDVIVTLRPSLGAPRPQPPPSGIPRPPPLQSGPPRRPPVQSGPPRRPPSPLGPLRPPARLPRPTRHKNFRKQHTNLSRRSEADELTLNKNSNIKVQPFDKERKGSEQQLVTTLRPYFISSKSISFTSERSAPEYPLLNSSRRTSTAKSIISSTSSISSNILETEGSMHDYPGYSFVWNGNGFKLFRKV